MEKNRQTILIIDDNCDVSFMLAVSLRARGFGVLEAENGEIGCELAIMNTPSLILCDEQMPGLNGVQTLDLLKRTPQTAAIPVLMIGGTGLLNEREWEAHGASGFVPKPFEINDLLTVVENILLQKTVMPLPPHYR